MKTSVKSVASVVGLSVLLALGGCANLSHRDRNVISGAGIGAVAGAVLTIVAKRHIATLWDRVMLADALGLGFFAAVGAARAEQAGANAMTIVLLAGLTAVGGGVIRDVLVSEIPQVLKSDFYATAALIGGLAFWLLSFTDWALTPRLLITTLLTFGLRLFAMRRRLELPKVRRLPSSRGSSITSIGMSV